MKLYVVIKIGADSTDRIKTTWQNTHRVFGAICSAGTLFTRHLSLTYPLFYLISILLSGLIMLGRSLKWIVTCTLIGVAMNTVSVQAHNTGNSLLQKEEKFSDLGLHCFKRGSAGKTSPWQDCERQWNNNNKKNKTELMNPSIQVIQYWIFSGINQTINHLNKLAIQESEVQLR